MSLESLGMCAEGKWIESSEKNMMQAREGLTLQRPNEARNLIRDMLTIVRNNEIVEVWSSSQAANKSFWTVRPPTKKLHRRLP